MNVVREIAKDAAPGLSVTAMPEGLSAILHQGCAAAMWQRSPLPSFQSWIDALDPGQLPRARLILRPDKVRDAVLKMCEISGTPQAHERALLVDDMAALADIFAGLMKAPYLLLRLDVISTNACRKFHVDAVAARLICTYRGTGTQYGMSTNGAEPANVFTAPTGAPILLRGTHWPTLPQSGLLHRSPPIEGTGETRLVLVLDPILDPEGAPDQRFVH
ncbi:MAG: DUF1826 domain-containing protein [Pseudomonadota bacterium]